MGKYAAQVSDNNHRFIRDEGKKAAGIPNGYRKSLRLVHIMVPFPATLKAA